MNWNLAPPIIEGVPVIAFERRNREIPEMETILERELSCGEETVIETFQVTIRADVQPVYVIIGIEMGEDGTLVGVQKGMDQLKRARKEREGEMGQDKAEYALLLGFIAAVVAVAVGLIGKGLVAYLGTIVQTIGVAIGAG